MADNIINSGGLAAPASVATPLPTEKPQEQLAERFDGLVAPVPVDQAGDRAVESVTEAAGGSVAMANPGGDDPAGFGADGSEEALAAMADGGTLGDRILRGMQGIREHVEQGALQVQESLQPARETMSMREMFHTQWAMTNLMITEDYIAKVVSKGTQAFDTLLRNQ